MVTKINYIAIDGPICVGKTTLVKMLAESMRGESILEASSSNPFLPSYYKDRRQNAFKTQIHFLMSRYQQQQDVVAKALKTGKVLCDYTFAKDSIFAKISLNDEEAKLYRRLFDFLNPKTPKPDLIVYLRASVKLLQSRIKERGVEYEKEIPTDYLECLIKAYDDFFLNYNKTPLLIVDVSNTDYANRTEDLEKLKKEISNHRGGTVHFISR